MRIFLAVLCFVAFALTNQSCTKTGDPITDTLVLHHVDTVYHVDTVVIARDTAKPIVGLWVGTFTAVNEPYAGNLYYSFDIRTDKSMILQGLGADGSTYYSLGTWTLNGLNFSAAMTSNKGIAQTITATYDSLAGKLTAGAWRNNDNSNSGTFELQRINN